VDFEHATNMSTAAVAHAAATSTADRNGISDVITADEVSDYTTADVAQLTQLLAAQDKLAAQTQIDAEEAHQRATR
jgi:hypothetical protein